MDRMDLLASVMAVSVPLVGGGLWLGNLAHKASEHERRIAVVEKAPLDIVSLQDGQDEIKADVGEIKTELKELRKEQRHFYQAQKP